VLDTGISQIITVLVDRETYRCACDDKLDDLATAFQGMAVSSEGLGKLAHRLALVFEEPPSNLCGLRSCPPSRKAYYGAVFKPAVEKCWRNVVPNCRAVHNNWYDSFFS
jgi:hypothetical protein